MLETLALYLTTGKPKPTSEWRENLLQEATPEAILSDMHRVVHPLAHSQGKVMLARNGVTAVLLLLIVYLIGASKIANFLPGNPYPAWLIAAVILVLVVWIVLNLLSHRLHVVWVRVNELLPYVLPKAKGFECLSALIDFVGWFHSFGELAPIHAGTPSGFGTLAQMDAATRVQDSYRNLKQTAQKNLIALLNDLPETIILTESNRETLCKLARNADNEPDLAVASLHALGVLRDAQARPLAQKLAKHFLPRIREAAKACLTQLSLQE